MRHAAFSGALREFPPTAGPAAGGALVPERLTRLLHLALRGNRLAWELDADGVYAQRQPAPGEPEVGFHETLMRQAAGGEQDSPRPWELRTTRAGRPAPCLALTARG